MPYSVSLFGIVYASDVGKRYGGVMSGTVRWCTFLLVVLAVGALTRPAMSGVDGSTPNRATASVGSTRPAVQPLITYTSMDVGFNGEPRDLDQMAAYAPGRAPFI